MSDTPIILRKFKGLNTKGYPFEIGLDELTVCRNYDITETGKPIQRPGRTLKMPGAYTNLGRCAWGVLATLGDKLCLLDKDFSTCTVLRSGMTAERLDYLTFGPLTVFSNSSQNGYVTATGSHDFPDLDDPLKDRIPPGQLLAFYRGRILVAQGNMLTQSAPVALGLYVDRDPELGGSSRQLNGTINLLQPVNDGIWIGDNDGIWWCQGNNLQSLLRFKKSSARAISGMATHINGQMLAEPTTGPVLMITTDDGACLLGDSGYFSNITTTRYEMPTVAHGCMAYMPGEINKVIAVLHS